MIDFSKILARTIKQRYALSEKIDQCLEGGSRDRRELDAAYKQHARSIAIIDLIGEYQRISDEIKCLESLLDEGIDVDDMRSLARGELGQLTERVNGVTQSIKEALVSDDSMGDKNVILEIRAGTGGDEAALFAANLFRMYARYAARKGWRFEVMHLSENGIGGYKEARAEISGQSIYATMKLESGVHRVQRVPETEASGRVHTSTATVAVLPEVQDVEVKIDENELRIDVYRSSGPGGQSVNTTDSAVRITHIPTGIVVVQQDEKSQHKNKSKAIKVLKARLHNMYQQQQQSEISKNRKQQIGEGDRSERIRTYNFPQSRVTDHRANFTAHNLTEIMNEGALEELHKALSDLCFHREFDDILNDGV